MATARSHAGFRCRHHQSRQWRQWRQPRQPGPTTATGAPVWCRRLLDARRVVLHEWVEAAGGWYDAAAVYIPAALPNGLALATLKAHARALGLNVRSDPDDPG